LILFDRGEPAETVIGAALHDLEEGPLEMRGHGAAAGVADGLAVHTGDGRDLGRGACEEDLVGGVEHLARDTLLANFKVRVGRQLQHIPASDTLKD